VGDAQGSLTGPNSAYAISPPTFAGDIAARTAQLTVAATPCREMIQPDGLTELDQTDVFLLCAFRDSGGR
jgi:hypothetical protein